MVNIERHSRFCGDLKVGPLTKNIRYTELDGLRGLAIVLMLVDHVLAVIIVHGGPIWLNDIRLSLTRLAMPLFMILVGWLLDHKGGYSLKWLLKVFWVGIAATIMMSLMDLPSPDILIILGFVILFFYSSRNPLAMIVLGLIQAVNIPLNWSGYQPGFILTFVAIGVLVHRYQVPEWESLCSFAGKRLGFLEGIGRHPVAWYLGHIAILLILVLRYA